MHKFSVRARKPEKKQKIKLKATICSLDYIYSCNIDIGYKAFNHIKTINNKDLTLYLCLQIMMQQLTNMSLWVSGARQYTKSLTQI